MHPPLTVSDREAVEIGERTYVLADAALLVGRTATGSGRIRIGSGTYLGRDLTIHCADAVTIGDDVMASDRVWIGDVEHEPDGAGGRRLARPRPVTIGDGVFLGTGATVLPGVTVGARSLVAAGAVVDRDVPENAAVAGNPARVIRRYSAGTGTWTGELG